MIAAMDNGVVLAMTQSKFIKGGDQLAKFLTTVAKQKARVDVGFFPDATYPDGTKVAEIAIYQEFGTKHIPPRPFMNSTFEDNRKRWRDLLAKAVKNQGNQINVRKALMTIGVIAQNDIKTKIDWWAGQGMPRNAASTIAKKGFDSPLIETGHMRDSVHFKVTAK